MLPDLTVASREKADRFRNRHDVNYLLNSIARVAFENVKRDHLGAGGA
jgi:hypothetical protein